MINPELEGEEEEETQEEILNQQILESQQLEQHIRDKRAYVWCFGKNTNGELGLASTRDAFNPQCMNNRMLQNGQVPVQISSGSHHSALVTNTGELFITGSALHGKLGL